MYIQKVIYLRPGPVQAFCCVLADHCTVLYILHTLYMISYRTWVIYRAPPPLTVCFVYFYLINDVTSTLYISFVIYDNDYHV